MSLVWNQFWIVEKWLSRRNNQNEHGWSSRQSGCVEGKKKLNVGGHVEEVVVYKEKVKVGVWVFTLKDCFRLRK